MATRLEPELDRLYALPASEFTAARNELAKRLRAEDRRDDAEQVAGLRKPTVAVWLANRVAREAEAEVERLLEAGAALTGSQSAAAGGASPEAFTAARRDEQQALERVARVARSLAAREGVGQAAVERAVQTLRAASLSEEGRELLKHGRLAEELEPPGFEALTGLSGSGSRARAKAKAPEPSDESAQRRREVEEAREAVRALRADERRLASEARTASREAERAEAEAARLRAEAEDAEGRAQRARAAVEQAQAKVERLRSTRRRRAAR